MGLSLVYNKEKSNHAEKIEFLMNSNKVDRAGKYSRFPGCSVVAAVRECDKAKWDELNLELSNSKLQEGEYSLLIFVSSIEQRLNIKNNLSLLFKFTMCRSGVLLSEYYSFLPSSSYHMTTHNLFIEEGLTNDEWRRQICKHEKLLHGLALFVNNQIFQPEARLSTCETNGGLQVHLDLPKDQSSIIETIADNFNISQGLPYLWHITLAYQYKQLPPNISHDAVAATLMRVVHSVLHDDLIVFDPPKLCYFEDMTAFYPWDVESISYPWKH